MVHKVRERYVRLLQEKHEQLNPSNILDQIVASRLTLPIIVFVTFLVCSLGIGGPAYLSDEIGYLSKAATIAGSTVHLATSWFAGYSFMISPAFLLSPNPYIEWNIILILNALMWACSAALLQYVLKKTHPDSSERAIFFATLSAMLYPTWLSMSSYAFATSGFVVVFMACLATLLKSNLTNLWWLALAAICAGYLCWIHPLGFLFLGLFIAVLTLKAILNRSHRLLFIPLLSLAVGISYLLVVQPWLTSIMSGEVAGGGHYSAGVPGILEAVFTWEYWLQTGALLIGLMFFTMVATFGLAAYGSIGTLKQLFREKQNIRNLLAEPESVVRIMVILAVVIVISFTALTWGASKPLRPDQWIYGRYTDMCILPLIAFGLLAGWQAKHALKIAAFVVLAGILLSTATNPENTAYPYINKVNLQSFWPTHLHESVRTNNYWVWGLLGAAGITIIGYIGTPKYRRLLPLAIAPVMLLAGFGNYMYQFRIARGYSSPSSLYTHIKDNYTTSDCIGFTHDHDSSERFNLYSYYLHGYNIQKMTLEQWRQQECKGPYLTYDSSAAIASDLQVKGLEAKTNLYMITHLNGNLVSEPNNEGTEVFFGDRLIGYAIIFR